MVTVDQRDHAGGAALSLLGVAGIGEARTKKTRGTTQT
jgi:hypothetical protein